jgi:hypothetical protein
MSQPEIGSSSGEIIQKCTQRQAILKYNIDTNIEVISFER